MALARHIWSCMKPLEQLSKRTGGTIGWMNGREIAWGKWKGEIGEEELSIGQKALRWFGDKRQKQSQHAPQDWWHELYRQGRQNSKPDSACALDSTPQSHEYDPEQLNVTYSTKAQFIMYPSELSCYSVRKLLKHSLMMCIHKQLLTALQMLTESKQKDTWPGNLPDFDCRPSTHLCHTWALTQDSQACFIDTEKIRNNNIFIKTDIAPTITLSTWIALRDDLRRTL